MVELFPPLSIWIQIASFCFFCAGIYSDLLLIRLCLVSAYTFLLINACMGGPLWGSVKEPNTIQVDGIIWALANLYVHLSSAIYLILDEVPVKLTEDEEALWRAFYRMGGISKKVFYNTVGRHMKVVHYKKDEKLPSSTHFHILYKGVVRAKVYKDGEIISSLRHNSGHCFDPRDLGLLHDSSPWEDIDVSVVSRCDTTIVFQFPKDEIKKIASSQQTRLVWQTLLMDSLSRIAKRFYDDEEDKERLPDDHILPAFLPLEDWEEPYALWAGSGKALNNFPAHLVFTAQNALEFPWPFGFHPTGIRHSMLPAPLPGTVPVNIWTQTKSFLSKTSSLLVSFRSSDDGMKNNDSGSEASDVEAAAPETSRAPRESVALPSSTIEAKRKAGDRRFEPSTVAITPLSEELPDEILEEEE